MARMQHPSLVDTSGPAPYSEDFAAGALGTPSLDTRRYRPNHAAQLVEFLNAGTSYETVRVLALAPPNDTEAEPALRTIKLAPGERYAPAFCVVMIHGVGAGADVSARAYWWPAKGSTVNL